MWCVLTLLKNITIYMILIVKQAFKMIIFNLYYYHLDFWFSMMDFGISHFIPFYIPLYFLIFIHNLCIQISFAILYGAFLINMPPRRVLLNENFLFGYKFGADGSCFFKYHYLGMTDACYSDNCCYILVKFRIIGHISIMVVGHLGKIVDI
ncbi:hypothetical protein RhiirC2_388615 [Rhizophagus irregularis]|uniref:Uncharacterized protein n=2 Tax=Rhizophagus irregularis TaxID=588596 RepID=A0A2N1NEL1_9GLOM|nr:hypothetical protein RhiirC2_388615 [Rhizophagus irregularis]